MDVTESQQRNIINTFELEKHRMDERKKKKQPIKKSMDENDYMAFDTYPAFIQKRVWQFIYDHVIKHPKFEEILKTFYLSEEQNVEQSNANPTNTRSAW